MTLMRKMMLGLSVLVLSALLTLNYIENTEHKISTMVHKECCVAIDRRGW